MTTSRLLLAAPQESAQLLRLGVRQRAGVGRITSAKWARARASNASVLANWPVARAKSRACRGFTTTTGRPAAAKALVAARSRPPWLLAQSGWGGGPAPGPRASLPRWHRWGRPTALQRGAGNVQLGFGHINTDKTWHVTHTNSCLPDLAHTGSMAPDNCTGSGSPGRDDPRHAPVSAGPRLNRSITSGSLRDGDSHTSPLKDTRL